MSRALPILLVDAFTDRPLGGNPAAVVPDAAGLDDHTMQRVAAELGRPGTGFALPAARPGADVRLRMFTPAREVGYSGHTALATVHGLAEAGRLAGERVTCDTPAGPILVGLEPSAAGLTIWLEPPLAALAPWRAPLPPELRAALGLGPEGLADWAEPALTPERDLLLPVAALATLRGLAPDPGALARLGGALDIRGFCLVSLETVEARSRSHTRFFAPHFGIPEDIVTGSVHSSLGVWLDAAGRLEAGEEIRFTAEQGDGLGRPGRLTVEVRRRAGRAAGVRVGGRAVTVLEGTLRLP